MSHVMNTYARQPVAFVRGQGVWLWDEAGKNDLRGVWTHAATMFLKPASTLWVAALQW